MYGHTFAIVGTPSIVTDKEYRLFWISWKEGIIQVGSGSRVGQDVFMQYFDPYSIPVNYIGWLESGCE